MTKWKTEVISQGLPSQWTEKAIWLVKSRIWFTSPYNCLNWHPFRHAKSTRFSTVYKEPQEREAAEACPCELGPSAPRELKPWVQHLQSQARVAKCSKNHLRSHCHQEGDGTRQGKWNGMCWGEWDGKWRRGRLTVLQIYNSLSIYIESIWPPQNKCKPAFTKVAKSNWNNISIHLTSAGTTRMWITCLHIEQAGIRKRSTSSTGNRLCATAFCDN